MPQLDNKLVYKDPRNFLLVTAPEGVEGRGSSLGVGVNRDSLRPSSFFHASHRRTANLPWRGLL
jgi:hypothetical protein